MCIAFCLVKYTLLIAMALARAVGFEPPRNPLLSKVSDQEGHHVVPWNILPGP